MTVILPDEPAVAAVDCPAAADPAPARPTRSTQPASSTPFTGMVLDRRFGFRPRCRLRCHARWLGERATAASRSVAQPHGLPGGPGRGPVRPDQWRRQGLGRNASLFAQLGLEACDAAGDRFRRSAMQGAGLGALAGRYKGGLGSASATLNGGITIGADRRRQPVRLARSSQARRCALGSAFREDRRVRRHRRTGASPVTDATQLARDRHQGRCCCAVRRQSWPEHDLRPPSPQMRSLTPAEAKRIAVMATDGMARAIRPVHTPYDGDVRLRALATGQAGDWMSPRPFAHGAGSARLPPTRACARSSAARSMRSRYRRWLAKLPRHPRL